MNNNHQRFYPTSIDLPLEIRARIVEVLNPTLATTLDLKTQVKQAHWNVKGMDFYQLHELFDAIASELEGYIDLFAERITTLGGVALGTARIAAQRSTLPEYPLEISEGKDHIKALVERLAIYAMSLRESIDVTVDLGDADTSDIYTQVSRAVDKRLWFLDAHLQVKETTSGDNRTAITNKKASSQD